MQSNIFIGVSHFLHSFFAFFFFAFSFSIFSPFLPLSFQTIDAYCYSSSHEQELPRQQQQQRQHQSSFLTRATPSMQPSHSRRPPSLLSLVVDNTFRFLGCVNVPGDNDSNEGSSHYILPMSDNLRQGAPRQSQPSSVEQRQQMTIDESGSQFTLRGSSSHNCCNRQNEIGNTFTVSRYNDAVIMTDNNNLASSSASHFAQAKASRSSSKASELFIREHPSASHQQQFDNRTFNPQQQQRRQLSDDSSLSVAAVDTSTTSWHTTTESDHVYFEEGSNNSSSHEGPLFFVEDNDAYYCSPSLIPKRCQTTRMMMTRTESNTESELNHQMEMMEGLCEREQ